MTNAPFATFVLSVLVTVLVAVAACCAFCVLLCLNDCQLPVYYGALRRALCLMGGSEPGRQ